MNPESYRAISDEAFEVLEQDDGLRLVYVEFLGLLHDWLSPFSSNPDEIVYLDEERKPALLEAVAILRESTALSGSVANNFILARSLAKIRTPEAIDGFLGGVRGDFERLGQVRLHESESV